MTYKDKCCSKRAIKVLCFTHWGREKVLFHIITFLFENMYLKWSAKYPVNYISLGSCNGLSPVRRQSIIWTNADLLLICPLGTNFNEIWIQVLIFPFKKMRLKISSAKWHPFYPGGWVNTLRSRQNGRNFADDTFKRIFLNENVRIPIKISLKLIPKGPTNSRIYSSNGSDNGLVPTSRQAIIWTNDG